MEYPNFFKKVHTIKLKDPLSEFLGTFESGIIEFNYLEIVKAAGHSCPTVAGAYMMCSKGLEFLYKEELPVRGQIKVDFRDSEDEGVTGVISNVFSHITGAASNTGFKGIAGNFVRHSLINFNTDIKGIVRLTRTDKDISVELDYNPVIQAKPEMQHLMQIIISDNATESEKTKFGELWQQRVEEILIENFNNPEVVKILS